MSLTINLIENCVVVAAAVLVVAAAVVVVAAAVVAAAAVVDDVHSQLLVSVAPLKAASATHLVDVSFSYVWHFHVLTCPFDAIVGGLHQYHLHLAELGLDFRFHQQLLLYSLFDVVVQCHQFPPPPLHLKKIIKKSNKPR